MKEKLQLVSGTNMAHMDIKQLLYLYAVLQEVAPNQGCPDERLMVKVLIPILVQNSARLVDADVPAGLWVTQILHRFKEAWVKGPGRRRSQISMQANGRQGAAAGGAEEEGTKPACIC